MWCITLATKSKPTGLFDIISPALDDVIKATKRKLGDVFDNDV
jgi:hypothetical protein